jgi:F-box-like
MKKWMIMSLSIDVTSNQYSINDELSLPGSINKLPVECIPLDELISKIFSYLDIFHLERASQVSKKWKRLVTIQSKEAIYIYRKKAFSSEKWAKYCGKDILKGEDNKEELSSLPEDIAEIFKSPCPAFRGKKVMDTHMLVWIPKTINGQPLTLNNLGELVKRYFPYDMRGYSSGIRSCIVYELGDKPIDKSRWVLMTKNILEESINKNYASQKAIVDDLAKRTLLPYEVPGALEAAVCILAQCFSSETRLLSDDSRKQTYITCQDNVQGSQVVVGSLAPTGHFFVFNNCVGWNIGVAALRKL